MTENMIERENQNALYLLSAVSMVFMTLVVAIQPLFLRILIFPFVHSVATLI